MNDKCKINLRKRLAFTMLAMFMLLQAPLGGLAAGLETPREGDLSDEDFNSEENLDLESDEWLDDEADLDFDFEDDFYLEDDLEDDSDLEDGYLEITSYSNQQISTVRRTGVTRRTATFREGPNANSHTIRSVSGNTDVLITGRSGNFYRVVIGGQTGWLRSGSVLYTRQTAVVTTGNAHVRAGRGTQHNSLTRVPRGQRLTIERRTSSWSRVSVNGHTGWIRNADLATEDAARPGRTTTNNVRVHARPRASSNVRHRLARGAQLMIVQRTTNGWSQVRIRHSDGTLNGWVRTAEIENRTHSRRVTQDAPLRSGPGSGYNRVRTINRNTNVTIRTRVGNWYHVHLTINGNRQYGWLHQNNLRRLTLGPNIGSRAMNPTWGVTYGSTRLRSGAGTNHSTIRTIADASTIATIHRRSGSWLEVTYRQLNNRGELIRAHRGWIHHDSIRVGTTGPTVNSHNGRLNGETSLRRGAGSSHEVIRRLNENTSVTILRQSGGWLQVRAGSDGGWVREEFVNSTTPGTTNITAPLRRGPGNNYDRITRIPSGVNLTILRHQGQWVNVRVEGRTGWMPALYVNIRTMSSDITGVINRVGDETTTVYVSGDPDLRIVVPTRRTIGVGSSFDYDRNAPVGQRFRFYEGVHIERVAANGSVTRIAPTWHASSGTWRFTHNDRTFTIEMEGMVDNLTPGTYERAIIVRRGNTVRASADQTIVIR